MSLNNEFEAENFEFLCERWLSEFLFQEDEYDIINREHEVVLSILCYLFLLLDNLNLVNTLSGLIFTWINFRECRRRKILRGLIFSHGQA